MRNCILGSHWGSVHRALWRKAAVPAPVPITVCAGECNHCPSSLQCPLGDCHLLRQACSIHGTACLRHGIGIAFMAERRSGAAGGSARHLVTCAGSEGQTCDVASTGSHLQHQITVDISRRYSVLYDALVLSLGICTHESTSTHLCTAHSWQKGTTNLCRCGSSHGRPVAQPLAGFGSAAAVLCR